jgi:chaperonin GroES
MDCVCVVSAPTGRTRNFNSRSLEKEDLSLATKLIPLADKLVIKPVVQEEVLASGIVIPDTAKEKPQQGQVIAVGPGRLDDDGKRIPMDLKAGDRVLYAKYSGQEVKIDRDEYIVLAEKDVLCKVQVK